MVAKERLYRMTEPDKICFLLRWQMNSNDSGHKGISTVGWESLRSVSTNFRSKRIFGLGIKQSFMTFT